MATDNWGPDELKSYVLRMVLVGKYPCSRWQQVEAGVEPTPMTGTQPFYYRNVSIFIESNMNKGDDMNQYWNTEADFHIKACEVSFSLLRSQDFFPGVAYILQNGGIAQKLDTITLLLRSGRYVHQELLDIVVSMHLCSCGTFH
jgi:hypothetical protein